MQGIDRMGADRTPSLLQRCLVVDSLFIFCKQQPCGKIKDLYDSALYELLVELRPGLLDASNKGEFHLVTRPEALAARAAPAASGRPQQPSDVMRGAVAPSRGATIFISLVINTQNAA